MAKLVSFHSVVSLATVDSLHRSEHDCVSLGRSAVIHDFTSLLMLINSRMVYQLFLGDLHLCHCMFLSLSASMPLLSMPSIL